PVPAVRCRLALRRALARPICRRAVLRAEVSRLGRILNDAVGAVAREHAARGAGAVGAVVLAVVALLAALADAVAAERAERAGRRAPVIGPRVLRRAEIALLAAVENAVAALEVAAGIALRRRRPVVDAVFALLGAVL